MVGESFEVGSDRGPDEPLHFGATACGPYRLAEFSSQVPAYVALNVDCAGVQVRHHVSLGQARLLAEALLKAADAAEKLPVDEYWKRKAPPAPDEGG